MWEDAVYLSVLSCICHISKFQKKKNTFYVYAYGSICYNI